MFTDTLKYESYRVVGVQFSKIDQFVGKFIVC